MCIIAVCEKRKLEKDEIELAFIGHSDGIGIAWQANGYNHYEKGFMNDVDFFEYYDGIQLPHVVHFRTGTSGGTHAELTHPFIVTLDSPMPLTWNGRDALLFHNGILQNWKDTFQKILPEYSYARRKEELNVKIPKGPWSDSRALAVMLSLYGSGLLETIGGGKYAVMMPRGRGIKTWGQFTMKDDILFSTLPMPIIKGGTWVQKGATWVQKFSGSNYETWHKDE